MAAPASISASRAAKSPPWNRTCKAEAGEDIDADGQLVTPPFVDAHVHMDSTLSLGLPRLNESGTLLEGIALWGELKPHLTVEAIYERAKKLCLWSIARGAAGHPQPCRYLR